MLCWSATWPAAVMPCVVDTWLECLPSPHHVRVWQAPSRRGAPARKSHVWRSPLLTAFCKGPNHVLDVFSHPRGIFFFTIPRWHRLPGLGQQHQVLDCRQVGVIVDAHQTCT